MRREYLGTLILFSRNSSINSELIRDVWPSTSNAPTALGISKSDSSLRKLTLPERRSELMKKARNSLHLALSTDTILASFEKSGLHPYNPSLPLSHPCILLSEENKPLETDETGKGARNRYNMSGKVITNLAEIEAIRRAEIKKQQRKVMKFDINATPKSPLSILDPLSMLPSPPKRRGRPQKVKISLPYASITSDGEIL
jgi:hypothetical protein